MAEELQENSEVISGEEQIAEQVSGNPLQKIFDIVFKTIRVGLIILALFTFLFFMWKISNGIFSQTQILDTEENINSNGTIDIYEKRTKRAPYVTVDGGQYTFEIKTSTPDSINAFVKIHIMLAYDSSTIAGYEPPKDGAKATSPLDTELGERKTQIQDILRSILVQKTYKELISQNSIPVLKKELINNINHILVNGKLAEIYFTEWNLIPTGY